MINQNSKVLLEIRGLHATVNDVPVLKGIDLTVKSGEIHAIMGINGSGRPSSQTTRDATISVPCKFEMSKPSIRRGGSCQPRASASD